MPFDFAVANHNEALFSIKWPPMLLCMLLPWNECFWKFPFKPYCINCMYQIHFFPFKIIANLFVELAGKLSTKSCCKMWEMLIYGLKWEIMSCCLCWYVTCIQLCQGLPYQTSELLSYLCHHGQWWKNLTSLSDHSYVLFGKLPVHVTRVAIVSH